VIAMLDSAAFGKIKWGAVIVDEGHRLKNFQSRLSRTLSNLHSPFRCLLTGRAPSPGCHLIHHGVISSTTTSFGRAYHNHVPLYGHSHQMTLLSNLHSPFRCLLTGEAAFDIKKRGCNTGWLTILPSPQPPTRGIIPIQPPHFVVLTTFTSESRTILH